MRIHYATDNFRKLHALGFSSDLHVLDPIRFSLDLRESPRTNSDNILASLVIEPIGLAAKAPAQLVVSLTLEGYFQHSNAQSGSRAFALGPKRIPLLDLAKEGCEYFTTFPVRPTFDKLHSDVSCYGVPEIKISSIVVEVETVNNSTALAPSSTTSCDAHPPYPHILLNTLSQLKLSDCYLAPANGDTGPAIGASKAILAHASPFFRSMFLAGDAWKESSHLSPEDPIKMQCSARALLVCLIHTYSGWVPGEQLPQADKVHDLCQIHKCNVDKFGLDEWHDVLDTSRMLGLATLTRAANVQMSKVLQKECVGLDKDVEKLTSELAVWTANS